MYIIIVGAGSVGADLCRNFSRAGHDVAVIDPSPEACRQLALNFDGLIIQGDGTSPAIMKDAGIDRADCLAAVTGSDKENMICCGLAKKHFQVRRTIGRVNDPVHESIFPTMGVDVPISATRIIARAIENESALVNEITLLALRGGEISFSRFCLVESAPVVGLSLKEAQIPVGVVVSMIERRNEIILPRGETMFNEGDMVYILFRKSEEAAVRRLFAGQVSAEPGKRG